RRYMVGGYSAVLSWPVARRLGAPPLAKAARVHAARLQRRAAASVALLAGGAVGLRAAPNAAVGVRGSARAVLVVLRRQRHQCRHVVVPLYIRGVGLRRGGAQAARPRAALRSEDRARHHRRGDNCILCDAEAARW